MVEMQQIYKKFPHSLNYQHNHLHLQIDLLRPYNYNDKNVHH